MDTEILIVGANPTGLILAYTPGDTPAGYRQEEEFDSGVTGIYSCFLISLPSPATRRQLA